MLTLLKRRIPLSEDHRRRVWRRLGQCAHPAFTIARHTGPQPGVMVWGAISLDRRTQICKSSDRKKSCFFFFLIEHIISEI